MTRFFSALLVGLLFVGAVYAQTPPTPTDLRVSSTGGSGNTRIGAYLTWQATQGTQQYRVYRSPNDSVHFAAIGTSTQRAYFDSTIVRGTRYYYYVKSFIGTTESARSNIANILVPIPPPLPVPTNLTAVNAPQGFDPAVRLSWRGGRGQWIYKIFRSTNSANNFRSYSSTSDTSYLDRGVRGDSTYYYYVRPTYSNGDTTGTPRSNTASVLVVTPPRPIGTIRGTVIADSTLVPIRNVMMSFCRLGSNSGGGHGGSNYLPIVTDSLGRYTALLDTGRYIVRANPPNTTSGTRYRGEYFDNCPEPSCATIVTVGTNTTFTANFGLARYIPPTYNLISGVVRDTANNVLRNARVSVIRTVQEMNFLASLGYVPGIGPEAMDFEELGHARGVVWSGRTDSLGRYSARVISNARYIAMASKEGYLPEYWNNKPTVEIADIIALGNRDTSGINFSLAVRPVPNNNIAGIVRDSLNTRVPSRVTLIPIARNLPTRYAHTDSLGVYSITAVEAGRYFVFAMPFSGYGSAYYKAGAYGVIRRQDADTVNITGNVTGINVGVRRVLSSGLTLVSGRIRSTSNANIAGVLVTAQDQESEVLGIGVTDASGAYSIDAVASGVVTIIADRNGFNASQLDIVVAENNFTMNNVNMTMSPEGVTSVSGGTTTPETFALDQNYPNPFNPSTTISFELPAASRVSLQVFNVLGQNVVSLVNNELTQGRFEIVWNGQDNAGRSVASGMYFYRLNATASVGGKEFSSIRKMLLLK